MQGSSATASTPAGESDLGPTPGAEEAKRSPAPRQDKPRTLGKYELLRLIARGGMGEVHLARLSGELGFEKRLVIKTIRAELATDPRFVELFAAEAKTAVALSHPNIAPIYELGRAADGTLFSAMGWVDGPSLQALLERLRARERTLEIGAALFITRELLDGLAHAHSRDRERPPVVHRDVTPRNVLVDRSGRVQIVDFGIAKPVEAEVAGAMGSAGYMAPEQARGELVDPRADVFGVGCVLYELLTKQRAFTGEGVWMLPSFAKIPEPVRPLLERALALEPERRFADAEAFLRALAPILAEQAPAFGSRDLAAIVAELFGDDEAATQERGEERTPATRIGPVETFATRSIPGPPEEPVASDEPELAVSEGGGRRSAAWPLAALLAVGVVGLIALVFVRAADRVVEQPPPPIPEPAPPRLASKAPPDPQPIPPPVELEPEPEPASTRVILELQPQDASVSVDGRALSGPPHAIDLREQQSVELRVEHPEHRPHVRTLDPQSVGEGPLRIELEPRKPGSLTVLAPAVAWAEVWLDGSKLGTTPLLDEAVLEGKHKLEVRCVAAVCGSDRRLLTQTIRVRPGRSLSLTVSED
ncbi:MAG: serine/threonine-protein kinase [Enhygromyxa sp.]